MPTRPVPPPVGYKRTSGIVQPSCSASSSPIVFLPSRRYGSLSVERSNQPICGATFATTLPAVAIEPSMVKTLAPAIAASAIAAGGVPRGTITAHGSPQRLLRHVLVHLLEVVAHGEHLSALLADAEHALGVVAVPADRALDVADEAHRAVECISSGTVIGRRAPTFTAPRRGWAEIDRADSFRLIEVRPSPDRR